MAIDSFDDALHAAPAAFEERLLEDSFRSTTELGRQVEAFLAISDIDETAKTAMRSAPESVQQTVLSRGMITFARNPSSALMARLRAAKESMADASSAAIRPASGQGSSWVEPEEGAWPRKRQRQGAWVQEPVDEAAAEACEEAFVQWGEQALQAEASFAEGGGEEVLWQPQPQPQLQPQPQWRRGGVTSTDDRPPTVTQRRRLSDELLLGEVAEWRGSFGWLRPTQEIEHAKAGYHQGRIFLHKRDLLLPYPVEVGQPAEFYLYEDHSGLGAEACVAGEAQRKQEEEEEEEEEARARLAASRFEEDGSCSGSAAGETRSEAAEEGEEEVAGSEAQDLEEAGQAEDTAGLGSEEDVVEGVAGDFASEFGDELEDAELDAEALEEAGEAADEEGEAGREEAEGLFQEEREEEVLDGGA